MICCVKADRSLRVINVARGGIVDEHDLAECIRDGVIAGAALDVFDSEPTTESPLFELPSVVVTPHLGASTREAQDKAGDAIADMVKLALDGDFVPWAVNVDAAEANETIRPFLPLAEQLGRLYGSLHGSSPDSFELCCEGEIAAYDTRIIGLAVLKGFFSRITDDPVSYVNAPNMAKAAGISMREITCAESDEYVNLISLRCDDHSISGHARRPPSGAADRRGRRPFGRRSSVRPHDGDQQRRPARRDRHGRRDARRCGGQHRRHGRRAVSRRPATPRWCSRSPTRCPRRSSSSSGPPRVSSSVKVLRG